MVRAAVLIFVTVSQSSKQKYIPNATLGQFCYMVCADCINAELDSAVVRSDDCTDGGSEGALVLKPAELVDLILEEQIRGNAPAAKIHHKRTLDGRGTSHLPKTTTLVAFTTKEQYNDKELLRSRKIWSRWGKWGDCSVTCGDGVIVRRRLCVSGRCAPHELEEQRRPCARAPCYGDTPLTDDLHDLK